MAKVPFGFTFVLYDKDDIISAFLALLSLTPVFIIQLTKSAWICGGLLFNTFVNNFLKLFFCRRLLEARPDTLNGFPYIENEPCGGFPSDHSQFIAFFGIIFPKWLEERKRDLIPYTYYLILIGVSCGCFLVAYSRVYLGYHTLAQVAAGFCIGSAAGLAYSFLTPFFVRLLCAALRLCHIDPGLLAEMQGNKKSSGAGVKKSKGGTASRKAKK